MSRPFEPSGWRLERMIAEAEARFDEEREQIRRRAEAGNLSSQVVLKALTLSDDEESEGRDGAPRSEEPSDGTTERS